MLILVENKLLLHQVKANSLIFYSPINLMILFLKQALHFNLNQHPLFQVQLFYKLNKINKKIL